MVNTRQGGDQPNIAAIIAEQLQNIIPQIVTQVTANVNNAQNANGGGGWWRGKVKYAANSLVNKALTWWKGQVHTRGRDAANGMTWNDFKALMREEFSPEHESEKLELELWNHTMVGGNHAAYTDRFHELARLVPHMVTPESSRIKRYIAGLAPEIRGMVKAVQPETIQTAVTRASILTEEAINCGTLFKENDKRKADDQGSHFAKYCREPKYVAPLNVVKGNQNQRVCFECGSPYHIKPTCPKLNRAPGQPDCSTRYEYRSRTDDEMVGLAMAGNLFRNAVQNRAFRNVRNRWLIIVPRIANQNPNGNGNVIEARAEGNAIENNEAGIQLQAEEFNLMAAAADLDKIKEVNANCILMPNLKRASTLGTQTDKAPVYDSYGSAENDSNVISEVSSVEQDGGTVDQHPATVEETRAYFDSLYNNLAIEVEKINTVNRKLRETNADLTTKLAR
ncbi:reverse transcriptase domain-containing protein [Tanacetum coccineum]|uniref:Reverse transcriptase domain-containing protein n=1 Tax=Tanacetum coccineum TaxID=301880 RepID=A0ABQ5CKB9_9ASTR